MRQAIDVVMLAYTGSLEIFEMNQKAIQSLHESEPEIDFRVILLESNVDFPSLGWQYEMAVELHYPKEKFNFNRFNNIGFGLTTAEWVLFCNNDVVFQPGWCSAMLAAAKIEPRLGCLCPVDERSEFTPPGTFAANLPFVVGHWVRVTFTGWCFLVRRSVFSQTGPFDERFDYYFADDDFTMQMRKADIWNAAVPAAHVQHLAHVTSKSQQLAINEKFNQDQEKFKQKWGNQRLIAWKNRLAEKILRPLGWKRLIRELYRHN
jgi:GT2 family glycosyltransferase